MRCQGTAQIWRHQADSRVYSGAPRRGSRLAMFTIRTMSSESARTRASRRARRARAYSRSTAPCGCSRPWPPRAHRAARRSSPSAAASTAAPPGGCSRRWRRTGSSSATRVTGRYVVGYAAFQLATAEDHDALARRLRPLLERTAEATGEIVTLAIAKRFGLVYVDQADPPGPPSPDWTSRHIPLHATSSGKVFLAWLPEEERAAVLPVVARALHLAHDRRPRGARPRARARTARRLRVVPRRVRLLQRRLGGRLRRQPPAGRDRQRLGPEPARDARAPAVAGPRGPARRARDGAAAGMSARARWACSAAA